MTSFFREGAKVRGEKLLYCYGKITSPATKENRQVGTLSQHGWVRVVEPLQRPRATPIPVAERTEQDEIRSKSARFEADRRRDKGKVPCGAHRCVTGYLTGNAEAVIQVPFENLPS